jgi:hypothetical protein
MSVPPPPPFRTHPFFDRVGLTCSRLAELAQQLRERLSEAGDTPGAAMAENLHRELVELAKSTIVETQPLDLD